MQSRKGSLVEILLSTLIGLVIAYVGQHAYFVYYGIEVTTSQNLGLMAWMTLLSVVRGYMVRRAFNRTPAPVIVPGGCPECGCGDVVRMASLNLKSCAACGHEFEWLLNSGQQPLNGSHRQSRK